jgi:hypothetical protein
VAIAAALFAGIVGYAGAHLVALNYPLSVDEFMAVFDAAIFRGGHLLAPLPAEWQELAKALQPIFLLDPKGAAFWSSSYLPVNAALHAVFAMLGDRALTAPVLAVAAVMAVYGVARLLWPSRPDAAVVAAVLLATSSQFLVTAMTPYAMTAHLALDLVWLWLFLRNTGASHGGAMVVGFAATGLHQLIFHPLFVAPFVLGLWVQRRFRLAALYTLAYAAICLFWVSYWGLILPVTGGDAGGVSALFARAFSMLGVDAATFAFMIRNMVRFIAWQNPATLILFIAALASVRKWQSPLPQLLGGLVLTIVAMAVILPYQGHGWGYRYLHGLLGSISLIAAYAWVSAAEGQAARLRTILAACTIFAVVILPVRAWQVHDFTRPYARAYDAIRTADADIVIVDGTEIWFGGDLVRNDPYLRNTPKVLFLNSLTADDIPGLCNGRRVAMFGREDAARFGIILVPPIAGTSKEDLRNLMMAQGCGTAALGDAR